MNIFERVSLDGEEDDCGSNHGDWKRDEREEKEEEVDEEVKDEDVKTEKILEHGFLSIETIENQSYLIFRSYTGGVLYKGYILTIADEKKRLRVRHMKSEDPEKNRKLEVKLQIFEINKDRKFEK